MWWNILLCIYFFLISFPLWGSIILILWAYKNSSEYKDEDEGPVSYGSSRPWWGGKR